MSNTDQDRDELHPEDAALVARIAEHWRAPEASPAERVAFQRRLDARLAAEAHGAGWLRALSGAAALAAGIALGWLALTPRTEPPADAVVAATPAPGATDRVAPDVAWGEATYALATEEEDTEGAAAAGLEDLPDDYVAIAGLFVDG